MHKLLYLTQVSIKFHRHTNDLETLTKLFVFVAIPQILSHPVDVVIDINNDTTSVQFTCMAAGTSSYHWQREGKDTIPANALGTQSNTLTLVNIKPTDDGKYRCVAVNEHGRNYSEYAKLTIRGTGLLTIVNLPYCTFVLHCYNKLCTRINRFTNTYDKHTPKKH